MSNANGNNENLKRYQDYFQDDLDAINAAISKSDEYSNIINNEIETFTSQGSISTRGGQHYLIEHIKNAVSLQSQKQSLLKDKVALKKIIMDYSEKSLGEGSSIAELQKELNKLVAARKEGLQQEIHEFDDEDIDAKIFEKEKENDEENN